MVVCDSILTGLLNWLCPWIPVFGYPIVFLVNLVGSASVFLPVPGFIIVFFLAGFGFNPWLLALSAAIGAAVGELVGYAVGFGGRKITDRHKKKKGLLGRFKRNVLERSEEWSKKHNMFVLILIFAATPLPDDIIGIIAGAINYDVKRFFIASLIGKFIMFSVLAWGGYFGTEWILDVLAGGL